MASFSGNMLQPYRRYKIVALFLAVFFGPWTWIYTFRKDSSKAALGLGLSINLIAAGAQILIARAKFLSINPPGIYEGYEVIGYFLFSIPIWFVIWLWSLTDTALKKRVWFKSGAASRGKTVAIILRVVLLIFSLFLAI